MPMGVVRVLRRRVGRMWQLGAVGAGEGTEVVVETVVLLDEEHDVLDRARNRATAASAPRSRLGRRFWPRLALGLCRRLCFWLGFRSWFCSRPGTRFFLHGGEFPLCRRYRLDYPKVCRKSPIHRAVPRPQ